ncbi:Core atranone cluster (CAC) protein 1 [Colletotrichum sp. SAR 10_65]|nr:Core atranone cluster (CAC) protein 1 [Colletotrichum sp. SAR 10_65]
MSESIQGPGLLFVNSKIIRPDLIDEDAFFKWYDEDHIAEILATSGIQSAFRFLDVNIGSVERPYLAMYPMRDIGFTKTEEFRNINVSSDMLPNGGPIYDLADFDVRYYKLVQVFDPKKKGKGVVKTIIAAQYELGELTEDEFDSWYRKESRALKGLSTNDEPPPQPPKWLAVHEFESEEVDLVSLRQLTDTEWTRKINNVSKSRVFPVFKIAKAHGAGDWFHNVAK